MSLLLDILVIGAFIVGISLNAKRGLVKSLLLVFGYAFSIWIAGVLSANYSGEIYDRYLEKHIEPKLCEQAQKLDSAKIINEKIFKKELGIEVSDKEVREAILSEGDMVKNLGSLAVSKKSGVDKKLVKKLFNKQMLFENSDAQIVEYAVNNEDFVHAVRILADEDDEHKSEVFYREIGRDYTKTATKWVMTLILYAVISSLLSLLITRINFIDKIPVARVLNTILGGVVGAGEGFIIIMIGALSIKVATVLLGFSDKVVYDTTFFKIFYDIFK